MPTDSQPELDRIRDEYQRRERELPVDFYALTRPVNLFFQQSRERALQSVLNTSQMVPLTDRKILDVGCGQGNWLAMFEAFGAKRSSLSGIELDAARAKLAADRFPGADIRAGNAGELPWPDQSFDIVLQSMVFTSVLDDAVRRKIAVEMQRVVRPKGYIVWYDFFYNNPNNAHVRAVKKAELAALFPEWKLTLRRITLAPPLARRIVSWSWPLAAMLERFRLFNTHYFGTLQRRT